MNTLTIIALAYVALDIIASIIIYAIIRAKGWRPFEMAVNFRNLMRMRNRTFKETIATQIGYADYNETYHEGYDNGYDDGYNARKAEEEEERKAREKANAYKTYLDGGLFKDILGIFGGLFM